MTQNETTKSQVILSLMMLNPAFCLMTDFCCPIGEAANQLEAFSVVAKHLPAALAVFTSIETFLKSMPEETQDIKDNYTSIQQTADACRHQIPYLQALFEAVEKSQNKAEEYRKAAQRVQGQPIERVMMDLLQAASIVAVSPFVAQDQITALQDALQEVKGIPPSLSDEVPSGSIILTNNGAGNQFYHGGRGHMNHCSGGLQVTGDNHGATYNHGLMATKQG
ncbi:hypothetical protein BHE90_013709 [Fusarium euwallaceae]|uniref:NACHT-NTPase and P-loop NTPases N-terminal domain-containing protein n=1 Tax=Fusarium euwallaceae TaxID=1147111 RepID=A0A430L8C5_9HYPO|nr:hypothetical protein BHE90_013709 [Fusarium euwallaceae]